MGLAARVRVAGLRDAYAAGMPANMDHVLYSRYSGFLASCRLEALFCIDRLYEMIRKKQSGLKYTRL